ncbi:hypothetical protein CDCA_CDCA12G3445 [Cyanidium caldarium]|uniref:ubiquitinyl hydrolase 1 n=1 Tax=Cyanidium caldarium TaxID=2771 RepID=A0AAV9IZC9_CYACA|nr:hypothetical protein CDCA_CDCA12G3445 [Cyanidium caldarium]
MSQPAAFVGDGALAAVEKEECSLCFDDQGDGGGVDVCLECFQCFCVDRGHARLHTRKTGHRAAANFRRQVVATTAAPATTGDEEAAEATAPTGPRVTRTADRVKVVTEDTNAPPPMETVLVGVLDAETGTCWHAFGDEAAMSVMPNGIAPAPKPAATALPVADILQRYISLAQAVHAARSSSQQEAVNSWELQLEPCEHTLLLQPQPFTSTDANLPTPAKRSLAKCAACDLTENLWMCLTCGHLGCGRSHFDGSGGRNHAWEHFKACMNDRRPHAVAVKLGTITPEGTADVHCYECDELRIDPELAAHLAVFGIDVSTQEKTEMSLVEMELQQSVQLELSASTGTGGPQQSEVVRVYGEDAEWRERLHAGLRNLGNSCYMASVVQSLFALDFAGVRWYADRWPMCGERSTTAAIEAHYLGCDRASPIECFECQMRKLADGLLSGRYASERPPPPPADSSEVPAAAKERLASRPLRTGIAPRMFQTLIGRGHSEFATRKQQDAQEFLNHFLERCRQEAQQYGTHDIGQLFSFGIRQKLECCGCHRMRTVDTPAMSLNVPIVRPGETAVEGSGAATVMTRRAAAAATANDTVRVTLMQCLDAMVADETVHFRCAACGRDSPEGGADRPHRDKIARHGTATAYRCERPSSLPKYLVMHMRKFEADDNWVPHKITTAVQLPTTYKAGGTGAEAAVVLDLAPWLSTDPDADSIPADRRMPDGSEEGSNAAMSDGVITGGRGDVASAAASDVSASSPEEAFTPLMEMGFTEAQARAAMRACAGDAQRAVEWLFEHPDAAEVESPSGASGTSSLPRCSSPQRPPSATPSLASATDTRFELVAAMVHLGASVHTGHYVAYVRSGSRWILYNDENTFDAGVRPAALEQAYLLLWRRCDARGDASCREWMRGDRRRLESNTAVNAVQPLVPPEQVLRSADTTASSATGDVDYGEQAQQLVSMGFAPDASRQALQACQGNVEAALGILLANA